MSNLVLNQIAQRAWQQPIINQLDFTTAEPVSPSVNDRYINTVTGSGSQTAQSVTATFIYQWNGGTWTEIVPTAGYALWDNASGQYLSFNGTAWIPFEDTISILDLDHYVSVSTSGDNSFSAKNVDKPIVSLPTAMSKASALSPGFTNPILVDVLDGDDFVLGSGGVTIPSYVNLLMKGATYNGSDVKLNDFSHSFISRHSASSIGYQKTTGSDWATIKATRYSVGAVNGMRCTSGRIDASYQNVDITAGDLLGPLCSADVNIDVSGKVTGTSTGDVVRHDDDGRTNMRLNDVEVTADAFNLPSGNSFNTLYANRIKAGGYAFDVPSANKILSGIFCEVEETIKSDTTSMNHLIVTYRRSGDSHDKHMWIRNKDGMVLDTPSIKAGQKQTFTNLGTTPVATFTFVKNTSYKIFIEATDGRSNVLDLDIGFNSGIPELVSASVNQQASYSVNGAITYLDTAGTDQYNITINGFVTASYNLAITRSTGATTLQATSATTGTTILQIVPISGI